MDISQEVIGGWRGERGEVAAMTLIWGVPFERRGRLVTAELGPDTVDEAEIVGEGFTLLAPDAYDDEYLDIVLKDGAGNELVRESLYEDDDVAVAVRRRCGRRRCGRSGRTPGPEPA